MTEDKPRCICRVQGTDPNCPVHGLSEEATRLQDQFEQERRATRRQTVLTELWAMLENGLYRTMLRDSEEYRQRAVEALMEENPTHVILGAIARVCFNKSNADDVPEIEQNAWRRLGRAILDARSRATGDNI